MAILKALTAAHNAERRVFARIIDMDIEVNLAKKIISYLMYLQSIGCKNLVKTLASRDDDKFLSLVCAEAERALSSLDQPNSSPVPFFSTSPLTFSLTNPTFTVYEIFLEKECVSRAVSEFYHGVSRMVFEDILEERGLTGSSGDVEQERGNENGKEKEKVSNGIFVKANHGEGRSQQGAPAIPGGGDDSDMRGGSSSKLNPNAEEWHPSDSSAEESRCLFITFSNGYPLSQNQIWLFFTRNFGPYVETIDIHQPCAGFPLFGKIVFKSSFVPAVILNGREEVRFVAFGRTIWCKKYHHRRNNRLP